MFAACFVGGRCAADEGDLRFGGGGGFEGCEAFYGSAGVGILAIFVGGLEEDAWGEF